MEPRINMITLGVRNFEKSVNFYENGLGFPRKDSPPQVAFFTLNGTWLSVIERKALAEDIGISDKGNGFSSFTLAHNVESQKTVDAVMEKTLAAGATLVKAPGEASWGGYSGYFRSPDEHLWEVAHNPMFWAGPEREER